MQRPLRLAILLSLLASTTMPNVVWAYEPTQQDVQAWFDREWNSPLVTPELVAGHMVRWREENLYVPPKAELDRLRKDVRGHPDHPERGLLARYEGTAAGNPNVFEFTFWSGGKDYWRLNDDQSGADYAKWGGKRFDDKVVTHRHAWQMSPEQLAILSDSPIVTAPGYDIESDRAMVINSLTAKFHAGLPKFAKLAGLAAPPSVEVRGPKWSVRFELTGTNSASSYVIEGRWDEQAGRGFVEQIISKRAGKDEVDARTTYKSWKSTPVLNGWIAGTIESWQRSRGITRRSTYIACESVSQDEMRAMTRIPAFDGRDAIRGPTTFVSSWDFRGGQERYVTRSPAFSNDPTGKTIVEVKDPPAPGRLARLVRRTGWIAGGLLIVGLAALKFNGLILARRAARAVPVRL